MRTVWISARAGRAVVKENDSYLLITVNGAAPSAAAPRDIYELLQWDPQLEVLEDADLTILRIRDRLQHVYGVDRAVVFVIAALDPDLPTDVKSAAAQRAEYYLQNIEICNDVTAALFGWPLPTSAVIDETLLPPHVLELVTQLTALQSEIQKAGTAWATAFERMVVEEFASWSSSLRVRCAARGGFLAISRAIAQNDQTIIEEWWESALNSSPGFTERERRHIVFWMQNIFAKVPSIVTKASVVPEQPEAEVEPEKLLLLHPRSTNEPKLYPFSYNTCRFFIDTTIPEMLARPRYVEQCMRAGFVPMPFNSGWSDDLLSKLEQRKLDAIIFNRYLAAEYEDRHERRELFFASDAFEPIAQHLGGTFYLLAHTFKDKRAARLAERYSEIRRKINLFESDPQVLSIAPTESRSEARPDYEEIVRSATKFVRGELVPALRGRKIICGPADMKKALELFLHAANVPYGGGGGDVQIQVREDPANALELFLNHRIGNFFFGGQDQRAAGTGSQARPVVDAGVLRYAGIALPDKLSTNCILILRDRFAELRPILESFHSMLLKVRRDLGGPQGKDVLADIVRERTHSMESALEHINRVFKVNDQTVSSDDIVEPGFHVYAV